MQSVAPNNQKQSCAPHCCESSATRHRAGVALALLTFGGYVVGTIASGSWKANYFLSSTNKYGSEQQYIGHQETDVSTGMLYESPLNQVLYIAAGLIPAAIAYFIPLACRKCCAEDTPAVVPLVNVNIQKDNEAQPLITHDVETV